MENRGSRARGYLLVGFLGAVGGGIAVALATKAVPRMLSQIMSRMMSEMTQRMMARMQEAGISPAEM
jgi:hypothetical protein